VKRLAGSRVPGDHGLALVGDPDPVQLGALDAGAGDRLDRDPAGHLPDLRGVVLDPARAGEVLAELRVGPPAIRPSSSKTRQVVPVVPWSICEGSSAGRLSAPPRRRNAEPLHGANPGVDSP
jgi:hypothetical protein